MLSPFYIIMTLSRTNLSILTGFALTVLVGFQVDPNAGLIIGLSTFTLIITVIIKNQRKHLDERVIRSLKNASFNTLVTLIIGSLVISLGTWSMYHLGSINEPQWFQQYSYHTAAILALLVLFCSLELYKKGDGISEII